MLQGRELFAEQVVQLESGKKLTIEFTLRSLRALEKFKGGDFQKVFDMFETDFNTENMILSLWACSLKHHKEEYGMLSAEEVEDTFIDEIGAENFLAIKLALVETFASFWKKAKESKQLPSEYQKVLDEMEDKNKKKA